jgi:hypothetical protein
MFSLTLIDDDNNHIELGIGTRDVLAFERSGGAVDKIVDGNLAETYKLAHLSATRKGLFAGTLTKFEDTYDIEVEDSDENLSSEKAA